MRAVQVKAFGDVDQLQLVELPDPIPGAGELVVRVEAAGLNYADVMQREGLYPGGPKPPYISGVEAAGVVEALGPGTVNSTQVGARVAAIAANGCHAERICVSSQSCIALPESTSFVQGAAFPVQYLTAYHALVTVAKATAGETVLIHAAAGGVGTAAVQISKVLGLRVFGVASTEEKRTRILELGADAAMSYDEFDTAVPELNDGRGPDIILESVGGDIFRRSVAIMPSLGRLVVFGASSKEVQPVDTLKLIFRSQAVLGFHLNAVFERPALLAASLPLLFRWIGEGQLRIQVGHTFPLAEIRKAHELIASRQSYGKIVLIP